MQISVAGTVLSIGCVVTDRLLGGVDVILGIDVISTLGGVIVKDGKATFIETGSDTSAKGDKAIATCEIMR